MSTTKLLKKARRREWVVFIYVLLVLFCFYPYEFNSVYLQFLPRKSYFTAFAFFIPTIFLATMGGTKTKGNKYLLPFALTQIIGFALVYVAQGNLMNMFSTGIYIALAYALVIFVDKRGGLIPFIKKYNVWILIMAILGSIAWVLVTFFGLSPISIAEDRGDEREIFNYGLTFSKTIQYGFQTIRYSGFFDEPGAMGYWGMFALLFNKAFVKSKKLEWLLIVFVSLTFSMGFYLQLLIYLFVFNVNLKNVGPSLVILVTVAIGVALLYSTKGTDNDWFYERTIGRVETIMDAADEAGNVLETDNRAEMTELAKKEFHENPIFGSNTNEYILDNIYEPLARYGIVGSIFILFPFLSLLVSSLKRKDYDVFKVMLVLCISFFHRPFHYFILYYFMLYCLIVMSKERWAEMSYKRKLNNESTLQIN